MSATPVPLTSSSAFARRAGERLASLDGVRALAAGAVAVAHAGLWWMPADTAVLAFFVLSGFIITWLMLAEFTRSGSIDLRGFYWRRSLRIFPAFYAYWLFIVGSRLVLHKPLVWPQTWASFFYVNNYYQALHGDPSTSLSHSWSLGIEEQFYLLWPALMIGIITLIVATHRHLHTSDEVRTRQLRVLQLTLAIIIVAVWIRRAWLFAHGTPESYIYEAFDTRFDHLAIGCFLAVAWKSSQLRKEVWSIAGGVGWTALCLLIASQVIKLYVGNAYKVYVASTLDPVLIAVLLVWLIQSPPRWLNSRLLVFLGTISYSTYIWQQPVPGWLEHLRLPLPAHIAACYALTIALASGSYFLIEKPFLRLKGGKRLDVNHRRRPEAAALPLPGEPHP